MNKLIGVFLTFFILLTGCTPKEKELTKYSNTTLNSGFDTFIQLIAFTEDEETFNKYFEVVETEFLRYHKYFDIYHNYDGINNLKTINDFAGIEPVKVDQEIIDMLKFAKDAQQHEDEFDISSGAVLRVWHNYREQGKDLNEQGKYGTIPSKDELLEAEKYIGMDYLVIDETNSTVYLTDEHSKLDVGGLAKGYAAEVVAKTLIDMGLEHGAVNAGGNLRTIGYKGDGSAWKTGVVSPNNDGSNICIFETPLNSSVVTSGDYQNFFVAEDGNTYHHICDLDTLAPVHYWRSVTILTDDSGMADLLSTTLFNEPLEEALVTIEEFKQAYNISLEVIFVTDKGNDYGEAINHLETDSFNIYYTDGLIGNIN